MIDSFKSLSINNFKHCHQNRRKSIRHSISGESSLSTRQAGGGGGESGRGRSASDVSFLAPPLTSGAKTTPTNFPAPQDFEEAVEDGASAAAAAASDAAASTATASATVEDVNVGILSPKDEIDWEGSGAKEEEEEVRMRKKPGKEVLKEAVEEAEAEDKFGGKWKITCQI